MAKKDGSCTINSVNVEFVVVSIANECDDDDDDDSDDDDDDDVDVDDDDDDDADADADVVLMTDDICPFSWLLASDSSVV